MEIMFYNNPCPCLRKVVSQVQDQEQTQQLRIADAMPDIGRVIGCWGQVMIRSKEWRGSSMSASGGVMAWVLYAPEDGTQPRSVDAWIPFQMKWDLPDTQRDGSICVLPQLVSIDARTTSARKLLVRVNVSVLGEALEPCEPDVSVPAQLPADVQLLTKSYPVELPREAGEKLFQIEEELALPGDFASIVRYAMTPQVLEQKVMAGRLVFRGKALLHVLYSSEDGTMHTWQQELPFSQYTELDKDHSAYAQSWIAPILTGLELERLPEQKINLKASIAAQYVILDRVVLDITQDAYSPQRMVQVQAQELKLPMQLDSLQQHMLISQQLPVDMAQPIDVCFMYRHPVYTHEDGMAQIVLEGQFQLTYQDSDGNLQSAYAKTENEWMLPSDEENRMQCMVCASSYPTATVGADGVELAVEQTIEATAFADQGIPMVVGLELGELVQLDPQRPSLILRRTADDSLWEIAKECCTTVDAIKKANKLSDEPKPDAVLLIPIM